MASGQSQDPGGAPAAGDQSLPRSELPSLNLPGARFLLDFWDNITIFFVKNLHSPAHRRILILSVLGFNKIA